MNKFFKQVADKAKEKAAPYVAQLQEKAATVAADASALAAEVREEIAVTKAAVVESLATLRNENHPAGATPKENFARGQALFYEAIDRHENAKEAASRALADTANRKATVRDLAQELLAAASEKNPAAFELAKAQEVVDQEQGELSLQERLRCRIRYFSDGVILGSHSFVESQCQRLKQKIGYKRKSGPTPLKILGSAALWVFRNLRVRKFD